MCFFKTGFSGTQRYLKIPGTLSYLCLERIRLLWLTKLARMKWVGNEVRLHWGIFFGKVLDVEPNLLNVVWILLNVVWILKHTFDHSKFGWIAFFWPDTKKNSKSLLNTNQWFFIFFHGICVISSYIITNGWL